jgi:porphobilinogen synthase
VFPLERPRRLRHTPAFRNLVAETVLTSADLVAPLFVSEALTAPRPISSLPGQFQHTVDSLLHEVEAHLNNGVHAFMLFGVPINKDEQGSGAWDPNGITQVALRELKSRFGHDAVLMADLCLDEYTSHGHCGVLTPQGTVDNDATIELYAQVAIAQAQAGAGVVAPSGMMDGQVLAIRQGLDSAGFDDTAILAYSAKYASAFYGPFREAVQVEIANGGDRRGYQQDYRNRREALREALADIEQGADMVMVKPAMSYLDVLSDIAANVDVPVSAYHVSGEYAMIKAAGERGWLDAPRVALEQLTAVKRAGANFILTYFANEIAEGLQA